MQNLPGSTTPKVEHDGVSTGCWTWGFGQGGGTHEEAQTPVCFECKSPDFCEKSGAGEEFHLSLHPNQQQEKNEDLELKEVKWSQSPDQKPGEYLEE